MVDEETRDRVFDAIEAEWPHADLSIGSGDRERIEVIMTVVEAMEEDS